eukprot:CAMPEP_0114501626 /NCGR_PEP_ID=MMETSP0109-20121206/8595_1 /TAXON_ID=29199 /ORGANISM="Chlorarachnion reptans, Strain CCCM449" /LENGTH=148 /DNA_ID=CAMNT_0001679361 /DNA_START=513 /DNA_END=955 /DNA_ORIENTATION=+
MTWAGGEAEFFESGLPVPAVGLLRGEAGAMVVGEAGVGIILTRRDKASGHSAVGPRTFNSSYAQVTTPGGCPLFVRACTRVCGTRAPRARPARAPAREYVLSSKFFVPPFVGACVRALPGAVCCGTSLRVMVRMAAAAVLMMMMGEDG